ncbi:MAG: hypothetical protein IJY38_04010 [Clostridia bacterium]|nr:hypothetical protein [Clostridia bacterium]
MKNQAVSFFVGAGVFVKRKNFFDFFEKITNRFHFWVVLICERVKHPQKTKNLGYVENQAGDETEPNKKGR